MLPGKQVQPASGLLTNQPPLLAPGNLNQYLTQLNLAVASSKYLVGATATYATIQDAVDAAVAAGASEADPAVIVVTPGFYTGDITLTNGGLSLVAQSGDFNTATCNILGNITCVDPNRGPGSFPSYYFYGFYILGKITLTGTASDASCPLFLNNVYLDGSGSGTDTITNNVTPVGLANGALYVQQNVTITADAGFVAVKSTSALDLSLAGANSRVDGVSIATTANVFGSGCDIVAPSAGKSPFDVTGFVGLVRATFGVLDVPASINTTVNSYLLDCTFRKNSAAPCVALVKSGGSRLYHAGTILDEGGLNVFSQPAFPLASPLVISSRVVEGAAGAVANKRMAASLTTADGQLACATALATRPFQAGYVGVNLNGVGMSVARTAGERTTRDCYFSLDGGATAASMGLGGTIDAGALLYWNGSVAGYQLATTDFIDFIYAVDPNDN